MEKKCRPIFVMLNLVQHPWPALEFYAAPKETAGHGS